MMFSNKTVLSLLLAATLALRGDAYVVPTMSAAKNPNNRRQLIKTVAASAFLGGLAGPRAAQALEACPPKAQNCVTTTWSPPSGQKKADAIKDVISVIEAYPQEGQGDVDGGGWSIASNDLASSGTARIEYKSSGKGNMAKFFNGGRPFVDDLNLEVDSSGAFQVRSSSRVGDSDFGVNAKRVSYLAAALKAKGWSV